MLWTKDARVRLSEIESMHHLALEAGNRSKTSLITDYYMSNYNCGIAFHSITNFLFACSLLARHDEYHESPTLVMEDEKVYPCHTLSFLLPQLHHPYYSYSSQISRYVDMNERRHGA